jgi:prepilin-type N-terminal cleavage/methylation domain-containing protein
MCAISGPIVGADTKDAGFSLVEVLVASALLVGAITTLAHVFVFAARANVEAQYATYATVLAMQKMEELRSTSMPIEILDAVDYADFRGDVLIEGGDSARAAYERRWTVEPLLMAVDAFVITVIVSRRGTASSAGRVRLITIRRGRDSAAQKETADE